MSPHAQLAVLTLINLLNYYDRYTVAGILTPLQDYFQISDAKAGLLVTAFIGTYIVAAPVFGILGDRGDRVRIMCGGILFWVLATLMGSFANSYLMFIGSRALVGVGEASYATISPALIGDLYSESHRALALGVFFSATPIGAALGYIVGSQVQSATGSWRWALRISPPLGVIAVMALALVVRDEKIRIRVSNRKTLKKDIHALAANKVFLWSTFSFTMITFCTGALAQWGPTLVFRQDGNMSFDTVSSIFGTVTCVAGLLGTLTGAFISKRLRHAYHTIDALIGAFGLIICAPLMCVALYLTGVSTPVFWIVAFTVELLMFANMAPCAAMLLNHVDEDKRAFGEALRILLAHALGDALSPYIVGEISDTLASKGMDEGRALMCALFVCPVALFFGSVFAMLARHHMRTDEEEIMEELVDMSVFSIEDEEEDEVAYEDKNKSTLL